MKTLLVKIPQSGEKKTVPVTTTGGMGTLNIHDALKGLLIAAVSGAAITLYQFTNDWINHIPVTLEWQEVARSAVSGAMAYISINFFQKSKVIIAAKELIP